MPISPKLAVLFYDGSVYAVDTKIGLNLPIYSDDDAQAFNEMQFLAANENVYFSAWNELESVKSGFHAVKSLRERVHFRLNLLVPVAGKPGRFQTAEYPNVVPNGQSVLHVEMTSFRPKRWPSVLKYKNAMHGFSDGSMQGYLRPRWAAAGGLTRKNKVSF